jgi:hypothetical protein
MRQRVQEEQAEAPLYILLDGNLTKKLDFPRRFVESVTDITKKFQPGAPAGQVCVDSE